MVEIATSSWQSSVSPFLVVSDWALGFRRFALNGSRCYGDQPRRGRQAIRSKGRSPISRSRRPATKVSSISAWSSKPHSVAAALSSGRAMW